MRVLGRNRLTIAALLRLVAAEAQPLDEVDEAAVASLAADGLVSLRDGLVCLPQ